MTIYKNVLNYIETPDGIKKIEENVNDILARKDNQYKGWKCWSGIYTITISTDGTVYNASCQDKKMGNVYQDDMINLAVEPHVCKRAWCVCAANLNLKKIKSEKYKECLRKDSILWK